MKILYYDCFSGISGDMNLGAMIDLGVDKNYLIAELSRLKLKGYNIRVTRDKRKSIEGTKVDVILEREHKKKHRGQVNLKDIEDVINASNLKEKVKTKSLDMFFRMAEAEGKVHGKSINEIHFHEIGAVDSIVDIVGAAICIDYLKPDRIMSSTVELGGGFVKCEHGTLPVPAPATVEIIKGIPVRSGLVPFETTTPTGAVILASNVDEFSDNTEFQIQKTGYGIGNQDLEIPNVLRVYLGERPEKNLKNNQSYCIIECNLDDMNPEIYDFVMDRLVEQGADDVFITPIIMKKTRPAAKLSVLCNENIKEKIFGILFNETTTLGLRKYPVEKKALQREFSEVNTRYGNIKIKLAYYNGKMIKAKPEYAECQKIARENKISIKDVYEEITLKLKDLKNK